MPRGNAIFTERITDRERYEAYVEKALPTILESGGRPVVVTNEPDVIEGAWHGFRTVVLEFDSVETASSWYNSAAYQAVICERLAAGETNAVIVGEFETPGA